MHVRPTLLAAALLLPPVAASAQAPAAARPLPTAAQQIAAAVLPLPEAMRASSAVLGYREAGRLVQLRAGTNGMICLADDPADPAFHVACYHDSMEPFMARGRALRASGVTGDQVDTVRFREVRQGTLRVPAFPAALYSLTGDSLAWDPATNAVRGARPLHVVYMPFATTATSGISDVPSADRPWLMFPGTPKAHLMIIGRM